MTTDLDLAALAAIDVHVHVESDGHGRRSLDDELLDASAKYFKAGNDRAPTVEQIADYYRPRQMAAVVFTVDATTATGHQALSSEEVMFSFSIMALWRASLGTPHLGGTVPVTSAPRPISISSAAG